MTVFYPGSGLPSIRAAIKGERMSRRFVEQLADGDAVEEVYLVVNTQLRALAECFLMDHDFTQAFCRAPAGIRVHHAYIGGLLEHVVTLLDAADRVAPLYPELDGDLLKMGVFLHDVGKVRELTFD